MTGINPVFGLFLVPVPVPVVLCLASVAMMNADADGARMRWRMRCSGRWLTACLSSSPNVHGHISGHRTR